MLTTIQDRIKIMPWFNILHGGSWSMIAGHTKFSLDGFFGLIKLKMRKSGAQNLADLVQVIYNSTIGGYNKAQTIYENGTQKSFFVDEVNF